MGLTTHLSDAYDSFSSSCVSFFFALEFDVDFSDDESDNEGSGSGFTSGSCISSCFEISIDRVRGLLFEVITKYVCHVCGIFSVSRSNTSLV